MSERCKAKNPDLCEHPNCPGGRGGWLAALDGLFDSLCSRTSSKGVPAGSEGDAQLDTGSVPAEVPVAPVRVREPLPVVDEELDSETKVFWGEDWSHHWVSQGGVPVAFVKTHAYEQDGETVVVVCDFQVREPGKGFARAALERLRKHYNVDHLYTTGTATEDGAKFIRANADVFRILKGERYTMETLEPSVSPMGFVHDWDSRTSEFNL